VGVADILQQLPGKVAIFTLFIENANEKKARSAWVHWVFRFTA
jgi:hypothetical protein